MIWTREGRLEPIGSSLRSSLHNSLAVASVFKPPGAWRTPARVGSHRSRGVPEHGIRPKRNIAGRIIGSSCPPPQNPVSFGPISRVLHRNVLETAAPVFQLFDQFPGKVGRFPDGRYWDVPEWRRSGDTGLKVGELQGSDSVSTVTLPLSDRPNPPKIGLPTSMAEQQPSFDAAKYKHAQREQWNKDGTAWRRWTPTLDRWYGAATRQMLDLARLQPGQRILDIAAGAGEPAVSAAERVGPDGYVLATDISEGIVALALQVARERGLNQVETRAMDGENLALPDASFDAVLCRLGLMSRRRESAWSVWRPSDRTQMT